jgi:predicted dehydrogenase
MPTPLRIACAGSSPAATFSYNNEAVGRLVAFCDTDRERCRQAEQRHGVPTFADFHEMLAEVECDVVLLKVPTPVHAEFTIAALERGLHVWVEKPLCPNAEQLAQIVRAYEKAGDRQVQMNLELRNSVIPMRVKELCARIGEPVHFAWLTQDEGWSAPGHRYRAWVLQRELTGGILNEKICHYFDLGLWWVGRPVRRVSACSAPIISQGYRGMRDNVSVQMWFEGGPTGLIYWSQTSMPMMHYDGAIIGTKGAVFWEMARRSEQINRILFSEHELDENGEMIQTVPKIVEEYSDRAPAELYHDSATSVNAFLARLQGLPCSHPYVTFDEAVALTKLCLAAEASADHEGEPLDPEAWYQDALSGDA